MAKNKNKGFTLIELLVVIAIIAILAGVVVASTGNARAKARDARRVSDLQAIATALGMYYSKNGAYPSGSDATGIQALVTDGHLSSVPTEPQDGDSYIYRSCSVNDIPRFVVATELEADSATANSDGNGTVCSFSCADGNTTVDPDFTGYVYCAF